MAKIEPGKEYEYTGHEIMLTDRIDGAFAPVILKRSDTVTPWRRPYPAAMRQDWICSFGNHYVTIPEPHLRPIDPEVTE